ncbi:GntR family transcriptional regulator [Microvirga vignae]|nr:GntR family transcriptional regulator [Microvirga vignae]
MSNLSSPRPTKMPSAIAQIGRLERVTLGERVHTELRDLLMSGELAPGQKMSLRSVAETLGVSMMPVREAVSRLVADQSLEVLPNRAVRVPLMTRARFRELTTVRLAVEGFAAEQASRSRAESDLAAMRRFEEAFLSEAQSPDPHADRAVRANKELHFAVYRATGLPTLVGIIEGLWLKIGPVLNFDLKASPERLRTGGATEHHRRLVAAVNAGDGDAARKALIDDIEGAASFIESTGRLLD